MGKIVAVQVDPWIRDAVDAMVAARRRAAPSERVTRSTILREVIAKGLAIVVKRDSK